MLQFSANAQSSPLSERKQSKDNVFTAAEENHFEFIDENPQSEKPGLFSIIKEMFSKNNTVMMRDLPMCIRQWSFAPKKYKPFLQKLPH